MTAHVVISCGVCSKLHPKQKKNKTKQTNKQTFKTKWNQREVQTKLDKKGKFGRVLGVIVADGVDLNQALIDNYHAVPYTGQSKTLTAQMHKKNKEKLLELGKYEEVTG